MSDAPGKEPASATAGRRPRAASARGRAAIRAGARAAGTSEAPYEAVLGQMVTIREDGIERRVTAAEAFLLHMTKKGLEGDSAAARATMAAIEDARASRLVREPDGLRVIVRVLVRPGSVTDGLEPLRMGRKLDRYRETREDDARALDRRGGARSARGAATDVAEQRLVFAATRTPAKVRWPDWWSVRS